MPTVNSNKEENVHIQGTPGVEPILNSLEIDTIEAALLEYGQQIQKSPETFRECEAVANAYRKITQARKAGCCDAIRMFGM